MKQIYVATSLMWEEDLSEIMAYAQAKKIEGLEIWHQQFIDKDITEICQNTSLELLVHGLSWDLNFASKIPQIRQASLQALMESIDFAKRIGAKEVTVHPGRMTIPNAYDFSFDMIVLGVHELCQYGQQQGIAVSIEIMESLPKEVIVQVEDVKRLSQQCPNCQFTLDIAHCETLETVMNFIESGIKISKFHISNRQDSRLHTPLDQGDHAMYQILDLLKTYDKPIVIEGFDNSKTKSIINRNMSYIITKGNGLLNE